MKTLVIANEKGGVGKTAISVHLAWAAMKEGKRVLVIDLDKQGNASYTLSDHIQKNIKSASALFREDTMELPHLGEEYIAVIEADNELADLPRDGADLQRAFEKFQTNIKRLEKIAFPHYDLCLIDTPPTMGATLSIPLAVSDFVVSPIEMEVYSLQGFEALQQAISNIKKEVNPKLDFLGLVPSRLNLRDPRQKKEYEGIKGQDGVVLDFPIHLRTAVAASLADKRPVWEIKTTSGWKAGKDFKMLAENIFQKMGV